MASLKRVFELLDIEPSIKDTPGAAELPPLQGKIEFHNVSFAYEQDKVLQNINLTVQPGESVALVGRTGSGKSTLINLIQRFYDPTAGKILVDGQDLRQVTIHSLRSQMAIVPQETALFSGTIKDNISYGQTRTTEREIREAAIQANIHDFIEGLPNGYQTEVGERGTKLSGGEKQRIAIARAILRNPKILILDEATSSLDAETESLIRDALEKLMKGRTTLIIAHRLSTIEKVNKIVVLDDGAIVESGTHLELLAQGGLYQHLHQIQFKNKA